MFTQRLATVALATTMIAGLSGCALVQTPGPAPLSGIAACTLGKTWNLDTQALAATLAAELATRGTTATVTVDGTQTFDWDLESHVVLDANYTVTYTSGPAETPTVVIDKHSGKATGIAYINAEVAIPREWDASGLNVTTTTTVAGTAADKAPYTLVQTDIDDSVGVELTCDGGTMTTHQRGSDITLTWAAK